MKNASIWLSFDLGIKGDFPGLYAWLDNHSAKECGNSVAYIDYTYKSNLASELKKDLEANIEFKQGDRIYFIRKKEFGNDINIGGKFIIGKRKSNPWEGYGDKGEDIIDGDGDE